MGAGKTKFHFVHKYWMEFGFFYQNEIVKETVFSLFMSREKSVCILDLLQIVVNTSVFYAL